MAILCYSHCSLRIFSFFFLDLQKNNFSFSYNSSYLFILSQIFITFNLYSPSLFEKLNPLPPLLRGIESSSFSFVFEISSIIRLLLMIIFLEGGIIFKRSTQGLLCHHHCCCRVYSPPHHHTGQLTSPSSYLLSCSHHLLINV